MFRLFQNNGSYSNPIHTTRVIGVIGFIIVSIIGITVFQDFLDAVRRNGSFYFSESILFKTIWVVFIPISIVLYKVLNKQNLATLTSVFLCIVIAITIHIFVLAIVFCCLSLLFYDGRYGLYKILSYTLANDLFILILYYCTFIIGYKYWLGFKASLLTTNKKNHDQFIIVTNRTNNTIIKIDDILQITATTPYINIHVATKKHLHSESLKSIAAKLDDKSFIRIHKSTIVNLSKVVSFKSRLNGDYDLLLTNGTKTRLSRTYAKNFKKHFELSHQVT